MRQLCTTWHHPGGLGTPCATYSRQQAGLVPEMTLFGGYILAMNLSRLCLCVIQSVE